MNFIQKLKDRFPEMSQQIDELHDYGAINDRTAKIAIVNKAMEDIPFRKQDLEKELADKLCVSQRTVKRYVCQK